MEYTEAFTKEEMMGLVEPIVEGKEILSVRELAACMLVIDYTAWLQEQSELEVGFAQLMAAFIIRERTSAAVSMYLGTAVNTVTVKVKKTDGDAIASVFLKNLPERLTATQ